MATLTFDSTTSPDLGGNPAPEPPRPEDCRILIVDDDEAIRSFLLEMLAATSYPVQAVSNGEDALKEIARQTYSLVITDLLMPRMDGLHLLEEVTRRSPDSVVLAITGQGTIKDVVQLMKRGAHDVLTKPFGLEEIRLAIEKALRHQALRRQNRELQARLQHSERMAGIGRLAAGVAHELNNPLDGVLRFVNLSLERVAGESEVHEYLTEARTGLKRMADIVRSLLRFSRTVAVEGEPRGIRAMAREAVASLRHLEFFSRVEARFQFDSDDISVPGGLFQVLVNLVKNAYDAMEKTGGELTIVTRPAGGQIEVLVADTGPGIPEQDREKVFEPFFTTKEPGKGTGLGLAISQRIMERYGGTLALESRSGQGTTAIVRLPVQR
jgi:signal transduction histidine kinase